MATRENEKAQAKTLIIIVNGRQTEVAQKEISFEEVVNLAFDNHAPTGDNIVLTVTFSRGDEGRKEGSLLPGASVKVKKGMVFDVTATDKS